MTGTSRSHCNFTCERQCLETSKRRLYTGEKSPVKHLVRSQKSNAGGLGEHPRQQPPELSSVFCGVFISRGNWKKAITILTVWRYAIGIQVIGKTPLQFSIYHSQAIMYISHKHGPTYQVKYFYMFPYCPWTHLDKGRESALSSPVGTTREAEETPPPRCSRPRPPAAAGAAAAHALEGMEAP